MFYHDHAYGLTRLNVYAGEAAGYLLHDPILDAQIGVSIPDNHGVDKSTGITGGGLYNYGIPLIIQDKTFVPPTAQLSTEDPTWNWGAVGNLWFPHVYMPNQAPDNPDGSGANAMGRWDLGHWFWPPMSPATVAHATITCGTGQSAAAPSGWPANSQCPPTPNPSLVPESFLDTPVVNGQAYPTVTLPQVTYRFQVLNAANDRMFNLSLFYASDKTDQRIVCKTGYTGLTSAGAPYTYGTANSAACTEVKMVAATPHPIIQTATGVLPAPETPADLDDTVPGCADTSAQPNGQPDVILGSGFLVTANPNALDYNPVTGLPGKTRPCWPSSWPTDGRDGGVPDPTTAGPAWVQIGTEGGVLPAPVVIPPTPVGYNYNRRDIVVLNVQEHALFLGPAERADVIVDLSQVPAGSTLILYNDSPAPVPGFDARLDYYTGDPDMTDTGGAPTTQPGYGPNIRTIMQIQVVAGSTTSYMTGTAAPNLAALQANLPGVFQASQPAPIIPEPTYPVASGGHSTTATYARIQNTTGLTYTPVGGSTAITQPIINKAIHELFENNFGRMNSILGTEVPLTNFTNQTTIPLAYVDPPTEIISDGQVQLWKVTHNGVDSHAIHFHLFDVQLINRVGWDGALRPPDPNELGWKETVRMNPLEDAIVALKPVKMTLPFPIGESVRLLDVTRVQGATNADGMPGFTNIDPFTNNLITTVNDYTNFGWEYVWHCHLLGHEENDMMRPIVFKVAVPEAPFNLVASAVGSTRINLSWSYTQGSTLATIFTIQRATNTGGFVNIGTQTIGAGPFTFADTTVLGGNTYFYRIVASNAVSVSGSSNVVQIILASGLGVPTNLRSTLVTTNQVIMTWTQTNTTGVTGYAIQRSPNGTSGWVTVGTTTGAASTTFRNSGLTTKTNYFYQVQATGAGGATSLFSNVLAVTTQ